MRRTWRCESAFPPDQPTAWPSVPSAQRPPSCRPRPLHLRPSACTPPPLHAEQRPMAAAIPPSPRGVDAATCVPRPTAAPSLGDPYPSVPTRTLSTQPWQCTGRKTSGASRQAHTLGPASDDADAPWLSLLRYPRGGRDGATTRRGQIDPAIVRVVRPPRLMHAAWHKMLTPQQTLRPRAPKSSAQATAYEQCHASRPALDGRNGAKGCRVGCGPS
jgi:hypothetical protein